MLWESPNELEMTPGLFVVSQMALCRAVKTEASALPR